MPACMPAVHLQRGQVLLNAASAAVGSSSAAAAAALSGVEEVALYCRASLHLALTVVMDEGSDDDAEGADKVGTVAHGPAV